MVQSSVSTGKRRIKRFKEFGGSEEPGSSQAALKYGSRLRKTGVSIRAFLNVSHLVRGSPVADVHVAYLAHTN